MTMRRTTQGTIKTLVASLMLIATYRLAWSQSASDDSAAPAGPVWVANRTNHINPERLSFSMAHTLTVAASGQRLISVLLESQQENPDLLISLPQGLRLRRGLGFSVDDGPVQQFVFTTSDANGAYARVPLTADRLASLRASSKIKIRVTGSGGREINFELSLAGFAKTDDLIR